MTPRIKAFKEQPSPVPERVEAITAVLSEKPTEMTVNGKNLATVIQEAEKMGALISSMTADRANYTLRIHWPADAPYGGGESANPRTPELDRGDSPNVACRPIQSDKQPEPLESVLDRIKQAAERNRRNEQLERRFGKSC